MTSHSCWRSEEKRVSKMKCRVDEIILVYVGVQVHFTCVHITGCLYVCVCVFVCMSARGSVGVDDGLIFLILQTAEE